jgi:tRNA nucleotidyltransferase (CCA-adding enzyme)
MSSDPAVRFAVLFQCAAGGDPAGLCRRLRAERDSAELLELLVRWGEDLRGAGEAGGARLLQLLERLRAWQRPQRWQQLLSAARALWPEQGQAAAERLQQALAGVQQVQGRELADSGLRGPELGRELKRRRIAAVEAALAGDRGEGYG